MSRLRDLPLFVAGVWLGASAAVVLAVLVLPPPTARGPTRAPLVQTPAARRVVRPPDPLRDRAAVPPAVEVRRG